MCVCAGRCLYDISHRAEGIPPNAPNYTPCPLTRCGDRLTNAWQPNPDRYNLMTQAGLPSYTQQPSPRTAYLVHYPPHQSTSGRLAACGIVNGSASFFSHYIYKWVICLVFACLSSASGDDVLKVKSFMLPIWMNSYIILPNVYASHTKIN